MNKKRIQQIKCLFTLVFAACTLFHAARSYAQTTQVTISQENVPMERVMNEIEKQTGYLFLSNNDVDIRRNVSVRIENGTLAEALGQMLKGSGVTYRLENKYISLSAAPRGGEPVTVKGTVTDANGPVIGATITIKGGTTGTTSAIDGSFSLSARPGDVLIVAFIGYKSVEIPFTGQTELTVELEEESLQMNAVVVTALGIKREEKALAYNVQQVKAEELTTVKDANFVNSLVGKVAGVTINAGAGGAGSSTRVVMRGQKSIEKSNTALYVIDGIPMYNNSFGGSGGSYGDQVGSESAADINPEDIESVNMLTGPSAAALYGSEAANGVIIINTKRGAVDKTIVTLSNSTMFSSVYMMPEMQNRYGTSNSTFSWGSPINGTFDARDFFNTGTNIINSVSVSTGNQKNQTYISVSTTNSTDIIPESAYNRYNFSARNTTTFAKERLTFDFGANFIIQDNKNMVSQGKYFNPLPALYLFPRGDDFNEIRLYERWDPIRGLMAQYWPYGEGAHSIQNPYWIQKRMNRETDKRRYMLNASLKWKVTDWLDITGRVRIDNSEYRMTRKYYATTLTTFAGDNGGLQDQTQTDRTFYGDVIANINKQFGEDWTLNAQIGASIDDQRYEMAGVAGDLKTANFFTTLNLNTTEKFKLYQEGWHDQTQAIFANVEVGWRSMLYLTLTGRNEWPSMLAYSKQSSFFYPSVGLSGVISNMVDLPDWFSFLKVRASYAQVASAFDRYLSNPSYTYVEQSHGWKAPATYPNNDLRPEDTRSWEIGVNARFLNKFNLDVTYYRSNTYHQTIYMPLASSTGYENYAAQTGNVRNQGVELAVGYNNKWGDFRWGTNFTYTFNENKIMELAHGMINPITGVAEDLTEIKKDWLGASDVAPRVILREGGSLSDIYVNHQLARDLNGNILISNTGALSMEEIEARKVGSLAPKCNLGWSNNFAWKGIDLGVVFTARIGGMAYSATQGILDYYGVSEATAAARDRGGISINYGSVSPQTYYQTISSAEGGHGAYYLYDATNVRLQELNLSYTLPQKWFRNKAKLTLGFVARNLWMIYCKAPFDPEISAATGSNYYQNVDYFMLPSTRNLGFNIKLQF